MSIYLAQFVLEFLPKKLLIIGRWCLYLISGKYLIHVKSTKFELYRVRVGHKLRERERERGFCEQIEFKVEDFCFPYIYIEFRLFSSISEIERESGHTIDVIIHS